MHPFHRGRAFLLVLEKAHILCIISYNGLLLADIISMWTVAGWKAFPAHIWCACVVFAWSALSSLQSSVQNFSGLAAIRFFLGIFEAMYAGVPVYLSFFYPRDKIGFRQGLFISGSALANAYGGALGYAVRLTSTFKSRTTLYMLTPSLSP